MRGSPLQVVAAVVRREGRVLVARRAGGPRGGHFEFPGGKVHADETHAEALARELVEELGFAVRVGARLVTVTHAYPDLTLDLHAYECVPDGKADEPALLSGDHDELRWVLPGELAGLRLCGADRDIAARLVEPGQTNG